MTTAITIISILVILLVLFGLTIYRMNGAIRLKEESARGFRASYADTFRQLSVLTSWSGSFRRLFYVRRIGEISYAVFMQVSLQAYEDPFADGSRFAEVLVKRYNTSDRDFNRMLAEEAVDTLNSSYRD